MLSAERGEHLRSWERGSDQGATAQDQGRVPRGPGGWESPEGPVGWSVQFRDDRFSAYDRSRNLRAILFGGLMFPVAACEPLGLLRELWSSSR